MFTAGSNAAGKSTALALTEAHREAHAIFDSTFSNPDHACVLIEQTLAPGKQIILLYIHRPLNDAMMDMLERSRSEGRVVHIDQLVNSYRGAAETVRLLLGPVPGRCTLRLSFRGELDRRYTGRLDRTNSTARLYTNKGRST